MRVWGVVPARGGSKSIPRKNLALLGGRPLIDYGVGAAAASGCFERIVCSTDDAEIAARAHALGVEVDDRPAELGGDDVPVAKVVQEFIARSQSPPEVVVLVQPTCPFLLPRHVVDLLAGMRADRDAQSGQTITPVVHNNHAWNQRICEGGHVRFAFAKERESAFNKQRKPPLFVFGNLVAVRAKALADGFFANPSVAVEIPRPYNLDIDTHDDLLLAEAILGAGLVRLPHMDNRPSQ